MVSADVVLLGPQRLNPTLREAVDSVDPDGGDIALVSAGWEEREAEHGELRDHVDRSVVNLEVFRRAEEVYQEDRTLFGAMLERHETLQELQDLYRLRLAFALEAARELMARPVTPANAVMLEEERSAAIDAVRALDVHHFLRVRTVVEEFEERWQPTERPSVVRQRDEIAGLLEGCTALCIAGGHVGILLNRMRVLGVLDLADELPIVAWSAGAMVVAEKIVLFHDHPPQGPGNAEVLGVGLSAFRGLVPLPHASRRLRLEDAARVAIFARRFRPDVCAALDPNTRADWDGRRWTAQPGTRRLSADGSLAEIR